MPINVHYSPDQPVYDFPMVELSPSDLSAAAKRAEQKTGTLFNPATAGEAIKTLPKELGEEILKLCAEDTKEKRAAVWALLLPLEQTAALQEKIKIDPAITLSQATEREKAKRQFFYEALDDYLAAQGIPFDAAETARVKSLALQWLITGNDMILSDPVGRGKLDMDTRAYVYTTPENQYSYTFGFVERGRYDGKPEEGFMASSAVYTIDKRVIDELHKQGKKRDVLRSFLTIARLADHDYSHAISLVKMPEDPSYEIPMQVGALNAWIPQEFPTGSDGYEQFSLHIHADVMKHMLRERPWVKQRLLEQAAEFAHTMNALPESYAKGSKERAETEEMARFLTHIYTERLFHIIAPGDPDLAKPVKLRDKKTTTSFAQEADRLYAPIPAPDDSGFKDIKDPFGVIDTLKRETLGEPPSPTVAGFKRLRYEVAIARGALEELMHGTPYMLTNKGGKDGASEFELEGFAAPYAALKAAHAPLADILHLPADHMPKRHEARGAEMQSKRGRKAQQLGGLEVAYFTGADGLINAMTRDLAKPSVRHALGEDAAESATQTLARFQDRLTQAAALVQAEATHKVPPRIAEKQEAWKLYGELPGLAHAAYDLAGRLGEVTSNERYDNSAVRPRVDNLVAAWQSLMSAPPPVIAR